MKDITLNQFGFPTAQEVPNCFRDRCKDPFGHSYHGNHVLETKGVKSIINHGPAF